MQIPRHWRLQGQRYNLTGTVCTVCGNVTFTERPVCVRCSTPVEMEENRLEQRAERRTWTVMEPAQR